MWQVHRNTASIRVGTVTAQLNLQRPHEGLHGIRVDGEAIPDVRVLQTRAGDVPTGQDEQLVDGYVRGTDLVAVYAQTAQRNVCAQIYWRVIQLDSVGAAGVEIIASVHTSLLDSDPRIAVGSTLPGCDVWRLLDEMDSRYERVELAELEPFVLDSGAGLFLFRLPDSACSYAEMIHPADFTTGKIRKDSSKGPLVRSEFRLFDEPLEKGVIRRSRVRGVFLPGEEDEKAAIECYRDFVKSAIPLTA